MFDFGEELMIDGYRVPWLVWIQLLVLFLLFFLLYCFSVFSSDLQDDATTGTATSSSSPSMSNFGKPIVNKYGSTAVTTHMQNFQVGEIQSMKGEIATSTGRRIVRGGDIAEREASPAKTATLLFLHPCHYFRLARWAFLKCFGIDSNSDNSTTRENRKDR